jgi:hypothetical protein
MRGTYVLASKMHLDQVRLSYLDFKSCEDCAKWIYFIDRGSHVFGDSGGWILG